MTSRSSPASLRGAPREAQEGPKRRQGLPKTTPRAGQRATRAAHMRSQSGLGGHLGHTWRPKAPRRPPGRHFGPLGVRCCSLRESIFEAAQDPARGLQGASGGPLQLLLVQPRFPILAGLGSEDAATSSASGSPKARLGASRELWGILVGTVLILCLSLPEPIHRGFIWGLHGLR